MSTTSAIVLDRLIAWGVDRIFGLIGDGINPLLEALRQRQDRIRFIAVRHEEAAGFMACAHAKFTGKLGVCLATSGPGALHLPNSLYDAAFDGVPVLAITGMPVHDLLGTQYKQDVDTVSLFRDVAKFNLMLNGPQQAQTVVDLACRSALGTFSVAHLAIPRDIQELELEDDEPSKKRAYLSGTTIWMPRRETPAPEQIEAAAKLLNEAERPMILAGRGALGAGDVLQQVAENLGAPIAKALLGRACIGDDSPYTTGNIGDLGTLPSKLAAEECDALLICGSNMPYLQYYPKPGQARAIQIDRDPQSMGLRHPVEIGLVGDVRMTLEALLPLLPRRADRGFMTLCQQSMKAWNDTLDRVESQRATPLKPQFVVAAVSRCLTSDAMISLDTGALTIFCGRHLRVKETHSLAVSGTLASMGVGLPYALAAKLAYPDRLSVALAGDGGFTMTMGDLITAVKYKLAVKVVIFKNNSLAMDAWEQKEAGTPEFGAELHPIDFVKFAEACGVEGYRCTQPEEVEPALRKAFESAGPAVIEMNIDAKEWPVKPQDVGQPAGSRE